MYRRLLWTARRRHFENYERNKVRTINCCNVGITGLVYILYYSLRAPIMVDLQIINQQIHNPFIYIVILHYNVKNAYMFRSLWHTSGQSVHKVIQGNGAM